MTRESPIGNDMRISAFTLAIMDSFVLIMGIAPIMRAADDATPFIADMQTGYLINCTFAVPSPYCWTKETILSGWQVDRSGGTYAWSPGKGIVHADWFKLID